MSCLPRLSACVALSLALGACDRASDGAPRGAAGARARTAASDTASEPFVETPTLYSTHFLFLATGGSGLLATSLHLVARAEPGRYLRDHRGWLVQGSEWVAVAWDRAEEPPVRRPWRIFPARGLRIIVGEQGELSELIAQAVDPSEEANGRARLGVGLRLDRWEDADAARRQIREAQLWLTSTPLPGILLEEQVARAGALTPPSFRPHDTAILRASGGDLFILSHTRDREGYGTSFAWASLGGVNRRWDRLDMQTAERMNDTTLNRGVPARWQVHVPEPRLLGELTATGYRASTWDGPGSNPLYLLYTVRGWIEVDGKRRDVAGVLEHGEP